MGCKNILHRPNRVGSIKSSDEDYTPFWAVSNDLGSFCTSRMLQLTILNLIACALLIGRCIAIIVMDIQAYSSNAYLVKQLETSVDIGGVIHYCQEERGMTSFYVASDNNPLVEQMLQQRYENTDEYLRKMTTWVTLASPSNHFRSRDKYHEKVKSYRRAFMSKNYGVTEIIGAYSNEISIFIDWITGQLCTRKAMLYWLELVAYHLLILSKEEAGVQRALGASYFAAGYFSPDKFQQFRDKETLSSNYFLQSTIYSADLKRQLDKHFVGSTVARHLTGMREVIHDNKRIASSVQMGSYWFDNMTEYINILKHIQDQMAIHITQTVGAENTALVHDIVGNVIQLTIVILLLPLVSVFAYNTVLMIKKNSSELASKTEELETERAQTRKFLKMFLPESISEKFHNNEKVMTKEYKSATVMFATITNIQDITSQCSPIHVIQIINHLFQAMDDQIKNYDVTKVEIVGGETMLVSGIPSRNGDKHVGEIARLSLDIMSVMSLTNMPLLDVELQPRIGFHTGPCYAGVVEERTPRFCVFGETVNIARQLEISGQPLEIRMTEKCAYMLLKDMKAMIVDAGPLHLKGIGQVRTFWLRGTV